MESEHFGGRTDDDLFADDFEPVAPEEQVATISNETGAPVQDTNITRPVVSTAAEQPHPSEPAPVQKAAPTPRVPRGLANSRHAPANRAEKQPRNNNRHPRANNSASQSQQQQSTSNAPPSAPKELREKEAKDKEAGRNTASVSSAARIGSGGNPRTKLTEDELAAKMEKMRIMAAEKTKRFEQAQRDETEHAAAYAKGMEEDKKRRAEQAAKKKAAEQDRKKMEEEREKNRERKMRAMGAKEGGSWDEGKEERMREEDRSGYRGHRGVANTAFARDLADGNEQGDGYRGGRRGGRGGFGGGRGRGGGDGHGGRTLFEPDPENESGQRFYQRDNFRSRGRDWKADGPAAPRAERAGPGSGAPKADKPKLTPDEFPALPGSKSTAPQVSTSTPLSFASLPLSPAVGRWDDEVQDGIWKNAAQAKEAANAQAESKEIWKPSYAQPTFASTIRSKPNASKNESPQAPANTQATPNAESPLASNEKPSHNNPSVFPMQHRNESDSQRIVNEEPTSEHKPAKRVKWTGFISRPAQVVAAHLGLIPPIPGQSLAGLRSLKKLEAELERSLEQNGRRPRKILEDSAKRTTEEHGVTSATNQAVAARQIFKRPTPDATPAPRQLPTALQFLEQLKEEEEEQREHEEYDRHLARMQHAIAESAIKEQMSHAVSLRLPLTERNKAMVDILHETREYLDNKRVARQYRNGEEIEKWVSESGMTNMRQWRGPNMHEMQHQLSTSTLVRTRGQRIFLAQG